MNKISTQQAMLAGLGGGIAYLLAQEIDRRVANPRSNDLVLLGGMVTTRRAAWRPLGLVMHLLAATSFGLVFDLLVAPRLKGPYWLRGLIMAQVENTTLWPLVYLMNRTHPAVQQGELSSLTSPAYFAQQVWRHVWLGAVMGAVIRLLRRSA